MLWLACALALCGWVGIVIDFDFAVVLVVCVVDVSLGLVYALYVVGIVVCRVCFVIGWRVFLLLTVCRLIVLISLMPLVSCGCCWFWFTG